MDTLSQALGIDTSGYKRADTSPPPESQPQATLFPARNVIQICSLPNLPGIFPSTNNIWDYHLGGLVPQFRAPLAAPTNAQTTTGTTTTIATSTTSSSSTTTNNPPVAQSASTTTPIIIAGNQFTGTILLAKSFLLYKLAVNAACRVRLYATAAAQSGDLTRPLTIPVGLGTEQGIISDVEMDAAGVWFYENTVGSNGDTPQSNVIYLTVTNLSGVNQAITATLTYVPLQA
jgi:hypothetical protein